jgi:hypothetical protein
LMVSTASRVDPWIAARNVGPPGDAEERIRQSRRTFLKCVS